jgi:hypothetical protein
VQNPLKKQIGGSHYKTMAIQPIEYSHQNGLSFIAGCIVKRLSRYNHPTGKGLEDIEKALHELDILIDQHRKGFVYDANTEQAIRASEFCAANNIDGKRRKIIEKLTAYYHAEPLLRYLSDAREHLDELLQELIHAASIHS